MHPLGKLTLIICCAGGCGGSQPPVAKSAQPPTPPPAPKSPSAVVLDDFEKGPWRWRNSSSGTVDAGVAPTDTAHDGKQAGRFYFRGTHGQGSWSDIHLPLAKGWPETAKALTFWARAEKPCTVLAKIVEGRSHDEIEHFGAELKLTQEWKQFRLAFADFSEHIWSSEHAPDRVNKRLDREKVSGFGFVERDFPVEFLVDQIAFE